LLDRRIPLIGRGLHREKRHDLEDMVLDHVPQRASGFIERASSLHAKVLGKRDLDVVDVIAVPHGFEERVGEPEIQEVHDLVLAEVVVDPEDRLLGKGACDHDVELARGFEVAAERFFDDDAGALVEPHTLEARNHRAKERRRNREVVRGMLGAS